MVWPRVLADIFFSIRAQRKPAAASLPRTVQIPPRSLARPHATRYTPCLACPDCPVHRDGLSRGKDSMLQKRFDQECESENRDRADGESTVAAIETTRSITSTPIAATRDPKKDEERISLFWRVFGGTILSIVALIFITLYNNLTSTISDLRNDLSREREARAALAKKDDVDAIVRMQFERIRSVEGYKSDIEAIKERVTEAGMASETTKKDLTQSFESIKKETAGLEVIKERIAAL